MLRLDFSNNEESGKGITMATIKAVVVLELEIECAGEGQAMVIAKGVSCVLALDPIPSNLDQMFKAEAVKVLRSQVVSEEK